MLKWLKSLFIPTVDGVLKDFNSVVAKLDKTFDVHTRLSEYHTKVKEEAEAAQYAANREADKARAIAAKIKALLS